MNKLFDLRFVIGVFFAIAGILLLIYSFTVSDLAENTQGIHNASTINRWCSIAFLVFGVVMIILSLRKDAHDEILEDENTNKRDGGLRGH